MSPSDRIIMSVPIVERKLEWQEEENFILSNLLSVFRSDQRETRG